MTAIAVSSSTNALQAGFAIPGLNPMEHLMPCICPAARADPLRRGNAPSNPDHALRRGAMAGTTGHAKRKLPSALAPGRARLRPCRGGGALGAQSGGRPGMDRQAPDLAPETVGQSENFGQD